MFHPATKTVYIAVNPYIPASERLVHVSSFYKCKTFFFFVVFSPAVFFSRTPNRSSGVDVVHATRQVCLPAEKTCGKETTRQFCFYIIL